MDNLIKPARNDAVFSFAWHSMDADTRQVVCLLANVSSEVAFTRWRQMQTFERVALRSALWLVIEDHWDAEQKRFSQPPQTEATT